MRLTDLIKLKNRLQSVSLSDIRFSLDTVDGSISQILNLSPHPDYASDISNIIQKLDQIENLLENIDISIPNIIKKVESEINEITQNYHKRGYIINGAVASDQIPPYIERSFRQLPMRDQTRAELIIRMRSYTDWKYPALEIGPGDGIWTDHLVAADPLYIVDIHEEYLTNTVNKFNGVYQKRIRPYLTGGWARRDEFDYSMLPKNQFGFIFSWNVFNYFPLHETQTVLSQCFDLLRPGGIMMFSFNNCDFPIQAEYVEAGTRSWMTSELLVSTCRNLGFNIIKIENPEETISWIEIKKPGDLKTIKSHQVLGRIIKVDT